jgi:hypothetical protein
MPRLWETDGSDQEELVDAPAARKQALLLPGLYAGIPADLRRITAAV